MNLNLTNKHIVVTGGTVGIGKAVVRRFLEEGCKVSFCARNQEKIDSYLSDLIEFKGMVSGKSVDATNTEAIDSWFKEMGSFDILIPNVSALSGDWEASLQVDINATVNTIELAIPYLKKSKIGAITYIGSKAASFATPGFEAYGACKAAAAHYVKSSAIKHINDGIRINTVSPGDTYDENGFWGNIKNAMPEVYEATVNSNPMGRLAKPEEIANVVAFISSPLASFVAGSNYYVDGASTNSIQF